MPDDDQRHVSRKGPKPGRVTIHDVAALAGVSTGTVSNVLNSPTMVSAPTLARVREAMTKLGWRPNQIAQQLRGG